MDKILLEEFKFIVQLSNEWHMQSETWIQDLADNFTLSFKIISISISLRQNKLSRKSIWLCFRFRYCPLRVKEKQIFSYTKKPPFNFLIWNSYLFIHCRFSRSLCINNFCIVQVLVNPVVILHIPRVAHIAEVFPILWSILLMGLEYAGRMESWKVFEL